MSWNIRYTLSQKQRGFTLLESIIALSVMVSLMSLGMRYVTQNAQRSLDQVTAYQLKQVAQAAQNYVQDHYSAFSSSQSVQLEDLVNKGYLSAQLQHYNCYGQAYKIQVIPEHSGAQLQVLLTTEGGQTISEGSLRAIANQVGGSGGYTSVLHPGKIIGSQQGWELEMASGGPVLDKGHLASVVMLNQKEVLDAATFLRRTKIEGHPEYNRMESDLEMDDVVKLFFKGNEGMALSKYTLESRNENRIITMHNGANTFFRIQNGDNTMEITLWKLGQTFFL